MIEVKTDNYFTFDPDDGEETTDSQNGPGEQNPDNEPTETSQ